VGTRGLGTIKRYTSIVFIISRIALTCFFHRMLLGSVSNYCVQHASCDVIVAK
jgi:hypothetical protein